METAARRTLQVRSDQREEVHRKMNALLDELDGKQPNETDAATLAKYRSDLAYFDQEIDTWSEQVDADDCTVFVICVPLNLASAWLSSYQRSGYA